ncbi:MAG: RlmE family RNA methyltransferase [bacterium]
MAYERKDAYWRRAKREGYRSRAAYKLLEIQERFRILRKGDRVLDLGCAPGGWLQVIAPLVGSAGKVVGVDRLPVAPLPFANTVVIRGDIQDPAVRLAVRETLGGAVHVVTSDMSPDLSGVGFQDHHRSCELLRMALPFCRELLLPQGSLLAKIFEGEEMNSLQRELATFFREVRRVIPKASRKASSEVYLLAKGYRTDRSFR